MKKLAIFLLLFVLLLTGCGGEVFYTPTGDSLDNSQPTQSTAPPSVSAPQSLTLAYYPEKSMNPYSATALSHKLTMEVVHRQASEAVAPCVKICLEDGTETGLAFHGVPGGHEFTSFVLGLYNAAGPGQPLDPDTKQQIAAITAPTELKILVTLSCTMCPDLVMAAQKIAASNPRVCAHVYDIRHFEELKNRYKVMSVPCLVMNDERVSFGKKNIQQVLDLIREEHFDGKRPGKD